MELPWKRLDDRQGRTLRTQKGLADILLSREGPFSVSSWRALDTYKEGQKSLAPISSTGEDEDSHSLARFSSQRW